MWNTFDINVLVNGSRCKQYGHEGKSYIEAKNGSEWYFQIQNNSPTRILAVCSVDGLNVLTGESASPTDSGYIIDAYSSQKIKGFRFSDEEWALFKFGYKVNGKTYAQSKGDGAEKNCGVIGVRLFQEKQIPKIQVPIEDPEWTKWPMYCSGSSYQGIFGGSGTCGAGLNITGANSNVTYTANASNNADFSLQNMTEDYYLPVRESETKGRFNKIRSTSYNTYTKKASFDMGTEWGKREKSKVETINFERGIEIYSTDIYYASRSSLIDMGVPINPRIKVSNSLPESFPNRYAKPPKGWTGE